MNVIRAVGAECFQVKVSAAADGAREMIRLVAAASSSGAAAAAAAAGIDRSRAGEAGAVGSTQLTTDGYGADEGGIHSSERCSRSVAGSLYSFGPGRARLMYVKVPARLHNRQQVWLFRVPDLNNVFK